MRFRLIAAFSVVVLLVGGLSFAFARSMLVGTVDREAAPRALTAAVAQLRVEGLATERWITGKALDAKVREAFSLGTDVARGNAATEASNRVRDAAAAATDLSGVQPALVAITDQKGKVLGRNGSALMRGDELGTVYPALKASLDAGVPGSDLWLNRARNEQLFASYAPIRGEDGKLLGALVVASLVNDERLSSAADKTSGQTLVLATRAEGGAVQIIAKSAKGVGAATALEGKPNVDAIAKILETGQSADLAGFPDGATAQGRPLEGYGDGRRAVVVAVASPKSGTGVSSLLLQILGVTALGIVFVIIFASILDPWITRPISELEDGLLAIINGKTDFRFELEHPLLGGLAFRINSLLNQLFGIQEDETDDQGRVLGQEPRPAAPSVVEGAADGSTAEASGEPPPA